MLCGSEEKNDLWSKYNTVQYVKHMMAKIIVSFVYHRYASGESFVFLLEHVSVECCCVPPQ